MNDNMSVRTRRAWNHQELVGWAHDKQHHNAYNQTVAIETLMDTLLPADSEKFVADVNLLRKHGTWMVRLTTALEVCMFVLVWVVGLPWGLLPFGVAVAGHYANLRIQRRIEDTIWFMIGKAARHAAFIYEGKYR